MARIYCAEHSADAMPAAAAQTLYKMTPLREEVAL